MSYIDTTGIRKEIRKLLAGDGDARTVPVDRIRGGLWSEAGDAATRARTLVAPRFEIPAMAKGWNDSNPSVLGSILFLTLRFAIDCSYDLPEGVSDDERRDAIRAQAEQDADVFLRTLMLNLGLESDVMNGSCRFEGMEVITEDWGARILRTRHRYTCIAQGTH